MNYCPNCGTALENGRCPNCGYIENDSVIDGDAVEKESKVVEPIRNDNNETNEEKSVDFTKEIPLVIKIILIAATLFINPLIGLICAIVLITRPYPLYKSFGIKLLIISIIFVVVYVVFGILGGLISFLLSGFRALRA